MATAPISGNEVNVDVGMDVHGEAIQRAFQTVHENIRRIQAEMHKVGLTADAAALRFDRQLQQTMRDFNKAQSTVTQFERNVLAQRTPNNRTQNAISGAQAAREVRADARQLGANTVENGLKLERQLATERLLSAEGKKQQEQAEADLRILDRKLRVVNAIVAAEKKESEELQRQLDKQNRLSMRQQRAQAPSFVASLAEQYTPTGAASRLGFERDQALRRVDNATTDLERKAALDSLEIAKLRVREAEKLVAVKDRGAAAAIREAEAERRTVTAGLRSDSSVDRVLSNRSLSAELNASRDLLDIGARRASAQTRINELMQRRATLSGEERKNENEAIKAEIERLRIIDRRIARVRTEAEQEARANARANKPPAGGDGGGGGGLFGNAGFAGASLRMAGYGAAAAAIYGTISAVKSGIEFSLQYEDALAKLGAIAGVTGTQLEQLDGSITKVAQNSRFSTLDLAEAATVLAQAGFTQKEIEQSLGSISQLATASGTSIAEATDVVTAAIGAFQLQAGETSHINDVLASALNRTKLNIQQVALGIQYAGATAHENNISFEELTATMAVMANAGIRSGSTIGTGIRQFLVDLQTPSEKLTEKLKKLNLTMADIDVDKLGLPEVLHRMASAGFDSAAAYGSLETRAAAAYLVLRNNREEIQNQIIAQNQIGQSAEAAAKGQDSLAAEWQRSKNILNGYVHEAVKPATEALKDLLKAKNDAAADPNYQKLQTAYDNTSTFDFSGRAAAIDAMAKYSEQKDALVEVEDRWSGAIERSTTQVNTASGAVDQQRTKLTSLDDAIARVHIRHEELSRGGVALQAEVSTLSTRFQGLANYLDTTATSYQNLTEALQGYRLEQLKLQGQALQSQEVGLRSQGNAFKGQAEQTLAAMRKSGVYQTLPAPLQRLIEQARTHPGNDTIRSQLLAASKGLTGNQAHYVDDYQQSLDKFVSARRGELAVNSSRGTVAELASAGGRALQAQVNALPGRPDSEIKQMIAAMKHDMVGKPPAAVQAYQQLITQAEGYIGSGNAPEPAKRKGRSSEEAAAKKAEREADKEAQMISFGSPVRGTPRVNSGVGQRTPPPTKNGKHGSSNHQGVDIIAKEGDDVFAAADGFVEFAGPRGGYGNMIILNHGAGTTTRYGHLSKILVEEGDEVTKGDLIGKVGHTGNASGAHLHYERRTSKGVDRNPLSGKAKGSLAGIADGAAKRQDKLEEKEQQLADRNAVATARMRVANAEGDLKDNLDKLNTTTADSIDEKQRATVEASFSAWEQALRDQLTAEDDRREASKDERLDHIRELNEKVRQKRKEVEESFFNAFMRGITAGLDRLQKTWEADEAGHQQTVGLAEARLTGLQAPKNRTLNIPDYVIAAQQRRIEQAQQAQQDWHRDQLPGRAAAVEAAAGKISDRLSFDPTLNDDERRTAEAELVKLTEQAAALRREYELLSAQANATKLIPVGFQANAQSWLQNYRQQQGLDGPMGFQWGDLFSGMTGAMQTAQSSLGGFFKDVINRTKTVGAAFKDMKDAVLTQIGDMIAQLLAKKAFQFLTSLLGNVLGVPSGGGGFGGGGASGGWYHGGQVKAFTGRYITAGVPNRDSVDARIAKGEYVVRKSAVDSVGLDFMNRLNERGAHAVRSMAPKPIVVPRAEQKMNVFVVAPEHQPQMGPNDVLVTIANDIANGGQTKQLIKHVAQGG